MTTKSPQVNELLDRLHADVTALVEKALGPAAKNVLMGAVQERLYQAILADVVAAIPVVGDLTDAARVQDAGKKGEKVAKRRIPTQMVDLVAESVPVIGPVLAAFWPANTINWLENRGLTPDNLKGVAEVFRQEIKKTLPK